MQSSTPSTHLLFADSKNRDVQLYPSGNSYVLHLTTPIKDIERVDLVSARVPNTMYNLTRGSNVMAINSSNVSMNPGFYSVYGLAQALTTTTLTLEYLPDEGHFLFSSSASFTIYVHSPELATMLGLAKSQTHTSALAAPTDPSYTGKYILRSSTLVDLSLNDYIFLDIDELRTPSHVDTGALVHSTGTVSGSNANRNFAPVIMDVGSACIKNFHENKDYRVSVEYPEPVASLQRLTVRWVNKSGEPLDFRGWDANAFVLRIHIKDRNREMDLPPPPPLQDVELKRIIDAMTLALPPPPKEESKKFKIPWFLLVLATLIGIFIWKTFGNRPGGVVPGPVGTAPGPAGVPVQFQR
jgi:hypothetical protein